jgi:hypothetical protein
MTAPNDSAIRRAFELAGVEFIDENGSGPGIRLRKRHHKKSETTKASLFETPPSWSLSMPGELRNSGSAQQGQPGPKIQSKPLC